MWRDAIIRQYLKSNPVNAEVSQVQSGSTAVTELIPVTICFALLPPSPMITNGWTPESINNLHSNAETVQFVKFVEEQNLFDFIATLFHAFFNLNL